MEGSMVTRKQNRLRGTEYGGVPGLVQPEPHTPVAREKLLMIYQSNPAAGFPAGMNPETEEVPTDSQQVR